MLIRRERLGDEAAIRRVHSAAFASPTGSPAAASASATEQRALTAEAQLVEHLRAEGDLVAGCCLVADRGGSLLGHVAVSRATLDGRPGVLALGPLGVDPAHQGLGVGTALMHACLAAADALDAPAVVLLGHPTYYPRFGFEPAVDHGITPPHPWGSEYFMVRRLEGWSDSIRGAFRYAPAFERLGDVVA